MKDGCDDNMYGCIGSGGWGNDKGRPMTKLGGTDRKLGAYRELR